MIINRRRFLGQAIGAPLAAVAIGSSPAWAAPCYDPAALPLSQKNRRRSLAYVERAADPARRCMGCAFFTAAGEGCGQCAMLTSTVNADASCSSFAARPK